MVLDRRGFMKFAAGAGAGIMVTPAPWKLLDDISIWTQNWGWIPSNEPGANAYVFTTSKLCPSACGMQVRMVNGRPVRALPSPEHPFGGGLSAIAAAEVQLLYSPARLRHPNIKTSDGSYREISWEEAGKVLQEKIKEAGNSVSCISGDETGSSVQVLSAFLNRLGSKDFYLMPSEAQAAARALTLLQGKGQFGYEIEKSDCVVAVGANVLESWGTAVRNRDHFNQTHKTGAEATMKLYYAGPVQNQTATVADQWLPIKPGSEAIFCLGLARALLKAGKKVEIGNGTNFLAVLEKFPAAKVEELTGLAEDRFNALAALVLKAKNPLVIAGSEFNQGGGVAPVLGAAVLNSLLDGPMSVLAMPEGADVIPGALSRQAAYDNDLGIYLEGKPQPKVLLVYEANPLYALPNPGAAAEVLKNIPFKVAFTSFLDETALACDLVLPTPLGLEHRDDIEMPYGCGKPFYAFSNPAIAPRVKAVPAMDFVLLLAKNLGLDMPATYADVLAKKAAFYKTTVSALALGSFSEETSAAPVDVDNMVFHALLADCFTHAAREVKGDIALAPMHSLKLGTPTSGIPPFNTKTLRASELVGKDMTVFMNGATASKHGFMNGSRVKLSPAEGQGQSLFARVTVFEGVAPDVAALYLGFGHTALDEFSQNKGGNIMQLLTASAEPFSGLMVWNLARVNIAKA